MTDLDAVAVAALVLLLVTFCLVRRTSAFLACSVIIAAALAAVTARPLPASRLPEWIVTMTGFAAWIAGLSSVRLMLVRSVSLRLLARLDAPAASSFDSDLRSRLHELHALHLVRRADGVNSLTAFGRVAATAVAACYRVLHILHKGM